MDYEHLKHRAVSHSERRHRKRHPKMRVVGTSVKLIRRLQIARSDPP